MEEKASYRIDGVKKKKTSNGCEVARRIPRTNAACRKKSDCVAAIDFGTANCSVAYILPGKKHEPILLTFQGSVYRVPTAILFSSNGNVRSFGGRARTAYRNLNPAQMLECAYFEQIKMDLQLEEVSNGSVSCMSSSSL